MYVAALMPIGPGVVCVSSIVIICCVIANILCSSIPKLHVSDFSSNLVATTL